MNQADVSATSHTSRHATVPSPHTLCGSGEMCERVRVFDWSTTQLGPIDSWPQSLKTAVQMVLDCGFPMMVLWGPQLLQIYNDGYRDLMGMKHPATVGQATRVCWPEVWHINAPIYERVWQGETITFEDALYPITRHGVLQEAFFTICYSPLRDETGAVAGVLVTAFERAAPLLPAAAREVGLQRALGENTQAEAAMRQSEERYRTLTESIDAGFCIVEVLFDASQKPLDYRFVEVNPAFERQTGIEDAVGRWMREIAPQHEEYWFEVYGHIALAGEAMRFESRADQLHRFYDVYAFRVGQPAERTVAVLFNDISVRKATEQTLAERERQLSTLLKVSDTIRELRDEGDIARAACRLMKDELGAVNCSYGFVYPEDDRVLIVADICDIAAGVPCIEGEWRLSDFGLELVALQAQGHPVVIEDTAVHPATAAFQQTAFDHIHTRSLVGIPLVRDGRLVAYFSIHDRVPRHYTEAEVLLLRDVAMRIWDAVQRSRAEAALRASEARLQVLYAQEQAARAQAEAVSRLKDEFLATVSHELRTPLTAFLGYAQMLQSRTRDMSYIDRTAEKMLQSAQAQARLVDDLLDASRIVSGKLHIKMQPADLIAVVQAALDTIQPAIEAKRLHVSVELSPDAGHVIGDTDRLQQVVWNLLANATKFTPPGGTLRVRLESRDGYAQLTVSDTGQGISAELLPFVFDRFWQADGTSNRAHGGLGLGLAIVRHLAELHGGTVQAGSPGPGQGATFTLRLPLSRNHNAPARVRHTPDAVTVRADCPPELRGLRVLIVDDQLDMLDLLYDVFATCGAVVQLCPTAREAIEIVRTWQPDVLIADITMPGEDGCWLLREVRALAPGQGGTTPAVALTADVQLEDCIRALEAGFQLYLPKPIETAELRQVVARLVRTTAPT
jgi:signal transduction histidine kinase/PAS domain-containing protein/ActR/RegA family two-component response regulator